MKQLKKFQALLVCLFLSFSPIFSTTTDSLYQLVQEQTIDSLKRNAFTELLIHLSDNNDTLLGHYALEMIDFAEAKDDVLGLALGLLHLGYYYDQQVDFEQAIEALERSRRLFAQLQDNREIKALSQLTIVYQSIGDKEKMKQSMEASLRLAQKSRDEDMLADAFYSIAQFQESNGHFEQAMTSIDSAIYYSAQADSKENYAVVLMYKANMLIESDPEQCIDLLKKCEKICLENNSPRVLIFVYGSFFDVHNFAGNKKEALEYGLKKLDLSQQKGDLRQTTQAQLSLGILHTSLGNYQEAEDYLLPALETAEALDYPHGIYRGYGSLANLYSQTAHYEQSNLYYRKTIRLLKDFNFYIDLPINYYNLVDGFLAQEQADSAFFYLQEGYQYLDETPDSPDRFLLESGFAQYYFQKGDYRKAIQYAEPAFEQLQDYQAREQTARILYLAYKQLGDFENALAYHEAFKMHQDSIFNAQTVREMTRQEVSYQFEREAEIKEMEQAQQQALLKAEVRQSNTIAGGVGIVAAILLAFFWNAFRQNKLIQQKNEQLQQLNLTKDHIFTVLGHDLRKPALSFRGISKKLKYLIDKNDFETVELLTQNIENNALQLNKLIDNLLNWALTQKNAITNTPKSIMVNDSVEEVIELFKPIAQHKQISLQSSIPKDLQLFVDPNAWQVILRNLLDNALKFTPQGGKVELLAQQSPQGVNIKVKDNGIGIPEEKLKDIFVFQKGKSTSGTKGEKGTGLGLYLINELIQINQGIIKVSSSPQSGTTFDLWLPTN